MGRLDHQKGFDLLIRAFAGLKENQRDWTVLILGEGPARIELEALRSNLRLDNRILMPGRIKNVHEVLQQADLFVMPSRYEGFPNALCEAMACGLPVICTDCPSGPREIIRHGIDGLLVANENIEALTSTMDQLMGSEAERNHLASRAPEVKQRFSLESVMQMWEESLKELSEDQHQREILSRERFQFGENWKRFLRVLTEERIAAAERSLKDMLGVEDLLGKSFLDVGSGSGLFSLVARRLGARVHSFDYDPESVACTMELKRHYFREDNRWSVENGSALDEKYLEALGTFDVVYSWGVLHHTGQMWQALRNVHSLVKPGGQLCIAIYNDQGWVSAYWRFVKKAYNRSSCFRLIAILAHFPTQIIVPLIIRAITNRLRLKRGMSRWHDMLDWLGGLPFEVAKPEQILSFYRTRGYALERLKTCGGRHGCNEFVFKHG